MKIKHVVVLAMSLVALPASTEGFFTPKASNGPGEPPPHAFECEVTMRWDRGNVKAIRVWPGRCEQDNIAATHELLRQMYRRQYATAECNPKGARPLTEP